MCVWQVVGCKVEACALYGQTFELEINNTNAEQANNAKFALN